MEKDYCPGCYQNIEGEEKMKRNIQYETLPVPKRNATKNKYEWSKIQTWLNKADHRALRKLLADLNITQEEFVRSAILEKMERYK